MIYSKTLVIFISLFSNMMTLQAQESFIHILNIFYQFSMTFLIIIKNSDRGLTAGIEILK